MEKNTTIVILVVALIALGAYMFVSLQSNLDNVVSVTGTAEIKAEPELLAIYVSIETLENSAQLSKDKNAQISDNVITALVKLGLDRKEIQTQDFNIYEEFDWSSNKRNSIGWKARNTLVIKTENFEKAGEIVDAAIDNGGLVQNINFEITKETQNEIQAQALKEAAEDAQNKAEALAQGSGGKLGKLVSLNSQDAGYYPYPVYSYAEGMGVKDARQAATDISPKDLVITASVQATYKIR